MTINDIIRRGIEIMNVTQLKGITRNMVGSLFRDIGYAMQDQSLGMIVLGEKTNEAAIKAITNPNKGDTWKANDTGHYWIYTDTISDTNPYDPNKWSDIGTIIPSNVISKDDVQTVVNDSENPVSSNAVNSNLNILSGRINGITEHFQTNLFDKNSVKAHSSIGYSYYIIPTQSGFVFTKNVSGFCYPVDYNGNILDGYTDTSWLSAGTYTVPDGAAGIYCVYVNTALDTAIVVNGYSLPAEYIPFGKYINVDFNYLSARVNGMLDNFITNLFDKSSVKAHSVSGYSYYVIPATSGLVFSKNRSGFCYPVDSANNILDGYADTVWLSAGTYTVPDGATGIYCVYNNTELDTAIVVNNNTLPPEYIEFGKYVIRVTDEAVIWNLFGDSISAETYAGIVNWSKYAEDNLNSRVKRFNYAFSGGRWEDFANPATRVNFSTQVTEAIAYNTANNITPKIITISIGTNSLNSTYGDFDTVMAVAWGTDGSAIDRSTVYGGMRWGFETLKRAYPSAILIVSTPLPRNGNANNNIPAMIDAITKMAQEYGLVVANAFVEAGFSGVIDKTLISSDPQTNGNYWFYDGLHLSEGGARMMGVYMASKMLPYVSVM